MIDITHRVRATAAELFAVLADGWSFAGWVVGASHIRAVDPGWPALGTRIHHSIGPWPVSIQDTTTVLAVEPDTRMELDAKLWPVGAARIRIELTPLPDGAEVHFAEELVRGPGRILPGMVQAPLLKPRNHESVRRLEAMALGRARAPGG